MTKRAHKQGGVNQHPLYRIPLGMPMTRDKRFLLPLTMPSTLPMI